MEIEEEQAEGRIRIRVTGNGFLYNMVRIAPAEQNAAKSCSPIKAAAAERIFPTFSFP